MSMQSQVRVASKYFLCKYSKFKLKNKKKRKEILCLLFSHKILQLLKLNPQISEVTIEQRISSFFRRFVNLVIELSLIELLFQHSDNDSSS